MLRALRFPPIPILLVLIGCPLAPAVALAQSATDLSYFTVVPCRVVDTRTAQLGGPDPVPAGTKRTFQMPESCGVPAAARAVATNITVTSPTGAGHLSIVPPWTQAPATSVLNYGQGRTQANNTIIGLAGFPGFEILVQQPSGGSVHLVVDVSGYYMSAACAATPGLGIPWLTVGSALTWDPVPGAISYNLYLKQVSSFDAEDAVVTRADQLVAGATSPFDITTLPCGVHIIADISAVSGGCESPLQSEMGGTYQVGWLRNCPGAGGVSEIRREVLPRRPAPTR